MHVIIERRGGFAGRPARGEKSDGDLTPAERGAVEKLLTSPPATAPAPGADRFTYHLTVEKDGVTRQLVVPEHEMPEELRAIPKLQL